MTNCNRKLKTQTFIKKQHSYTKIETVPCTNKRALRERKPPPMSKFPPKVIRDSNPDFQINLDPDVCKICLKMFQMHYLVGISHFACIVQIGVNCMRNANKCLKIPYSAMVKKMKKWSGIQTQVRITTKS